MYCQCCPYISGYPCKSLKRGALVFGITLPNSRYTLWPRESQQSLHIKGESHAPPLLPHFSLSQIPHLRKPSLLLLRPEKLLKFIPYSYTQGVHNSTEFHFFSPCSLKMFTFLQVCIECYPLFSNA